MPNEIKHATEQSEEEYRRRLNEKVPHSILMGYHEEENAAPSPSLYVGREAGDGDHEFCHIQFQFGPLSEVGRNGIFVEDLLPELVKFLQGVSGVVPSRETSLAITKLQEAQFWLNERTRLRRTQNVEGTYKSHRS